MPRFSYPHPSLELGLTKVQLIFELRSDADQLSVGMLQGEPRKPPEVHKPYTTPPGFVPPTIGEQWRYVSYYLDIHLILHFWETRLYMIKASHLPSSHPFSDSRHTYTHEAIVREVCTI